ncbi:Polysaccharide pyruvyl transferase [Butyrivibrio sp. Su6]|uniref:polysaccharide pyruvyl transferase family protein n=1 Tax=Butyrivibrio sp. Su6 TaxID=1520810 RepID=UPI00089EDBA7|nr:polysaccharide pyruvyl transferase family protein [Butyrivibrio sp. Su6]SEG19714.1 Polysaccharide pyruvyl transferase [Butyrivibrio sp. Su6]
MNNIAIVTFNDANNYGAFLQEYALFNYLKKNNCNVNVVNYENEEFLQQYKYANNLLKRKGILNKLKILYDIIFRTDIYKKKIQREHLFEQCKLKEISLTEKVTSGNDLRQSFDYYIAGSDQVWNVNITDHNLFYFLDFVNDNKKKVSYAASFGNNDFSDDDYQIFKKYISCFKKVLVREESGKKMLAEKCGIESDVVLDPTFLLNVNEWYSFSDKSCIDYSLKKYVLVYLVFRSNDIIDAAYEYAKDHQCELILIGCKSVVKRNGFVIKAMNNIGPYEFVHLIRYARAVFSTSFHGTALAINMRVPFFYEIPDEGRRLRLSDLMVKLNVGNRDISRGNIDGDINWDDVSRCLDKNRQISERLLLDSVGILKMDEKCL